MKRPQPALTGGIIDRADQVRIDADAIAGYMDWRARLLRFNGLEPEIDAEGRLVWCSIADAAQDSDLLFLGLLEGKGCFVEMPAGGAVDTGVFNPRMWQAMATLPREDLAHYGAARGLLAWHGKHRFCSNCGASTKVAKGGWSRHCEACGTDHFPRVDPVAIMLAEHERDGVKRVLLGRQPRFPARRLSALAGFIEPGESIEEGVARELWEEAGVRVRDVEYVASQPWPFPSSLMIGCLSTADDDTLTLDEQEIEEAGWYTADEVRAAFAGDEDAPFIAPNAFAIAHDLLRYWLDLQDGRQES